MSRAQRWLIRFDGELAWVRDLESSLADAPRQPVVQRWWQRRQEALDRALVPLRSDERYEFGLPKAPAKVRRVALERLRRAAPKLCGLKLIGAPEMLVTRAKQERDACVAALAPATPRPHDTAPVPETKTAFIDAMLRCAAVCAQKLTIEALDAKVTGDDDGPDLRLDASYWNPPDLALPNTVLDSRGKPAVAEAGGPITWQKVDSERVLVSFIWMEHDSSGDWNPWL